MAKLENEFWQGRRVLVTGHTGFKGSWLTLWLANKGALVSGLALAPDTVPSLFELLHSEANLTSYIADIRDVAAVGRIVEASQPEVVFHLAAQPLVRRSYRDPVETYSTNVMGTVHLLEAVRTCPSVKAVVVVTSDKCYENREWHWGYREGEAMGGYDPYSNSKGCAELVVGAYRSSFFGQARSAGLATARAGNVIGGGDWADDRLIPDLISAYGRGEVAQIRFPNAVRPWQHVLEPLSGYMLLAEKLVKEGQGWAQPWNFGPNESDARPVSWLADELASLWGPGASWTKDPASQPHEAAILKLDCSKARHLLGWQPRWDLRRTLRAIVDWHTAHQRGENMRAFSTRQIQNFENSHAND